ncbi:helix-turn-helix transcriptional regulator [Microvirga terricola]|uniref:XRE family transcriptional regulator n=1 Tax=Microvirga terricola TaxID=2719797 RepID=A0ABX0V5V5_9HYPH|nr:XRE family transcriptional regulator [Microvirga terricola]NIX75204.1 XRE family transcriptional regulator [Microvirga terricola]
MIHYSQDVNKIPTALKFQLSRGLRRIEAAHYIGVSATKFDEMVKDGRMPRPMKIDGCVIWDIRELDAAFDNLSVNQNTVNPWDA